MTVITTSEESPKTKHILNERISTRAFGLTGAARTRIALVGAGGNGSQMVSCLVRMDRALRVLGLPPLSVTLYDPDTVSASNVARQLFYPDDVGHSKAVVLIHRANVGFGLNWEAVPALYAPPPDTRDSQDNGGLIDTYRRTAPAHYAAEADILITCVDTGRARQDIVSALWQRADAPAYWLDIGNEDSTGQVWLGEFPRFLEDCSASGRSRLPCITEAFPSFFDGSVPETGAPSCSLAEALVSQDLFVNDICARMAAHLLWTLLRYAEIEHHGYWINLRDGSVRPQPVPASGSGTK